MSDSGKIDIQGLSDKLFDLAKECCWNNLSNSYAYIISEIVNDGLNIHEKSKKRKEQNSTKIPMDLTHAGSELDKLYFMLYDVNWELLGLRYKWNAFWHRIRLSRMKPL